MNCHKNRIGSLAFEVVSIGFFSLYSAAFGQNPTPKLSVTPAGVILSATKTQQFTVVTAGSAAIPVHWTISPVVGTISPAGLYTAPAAIASLQIVTVMATTTSGPALAASARVLLAATPPSPPAPPPLLATAELLAHAARYVKVITDEPFTWSPQRKACAAMTPGINTTPGVSFNGFSPWAPTSEWHTNVSGAPADPSSVKWINTIGGNQGIVLGATAPIAATDNAGIGRYGMPFHIVAGNQPKVDVSYDLASQPAIAAISTESYPGYADPGPFPIPLPPAIQSTQGPGGAVNYMVPGDKHLFVVDKDNCFLHEFWNTFYYNGRIYAGMSATFDLVGGDHQRPWGWPSSSVSGVPQFAGMARYDEVATGHIDHALAFTAAYQWGRAGFTGLAENHQWNNNNTPDLPPFGAKLRLKQGYDVSKLSPQTQIILNTLKRYGAVYVDGGHPADMYYSTDNNWDWTAMGEIWHVLVNPDNFDFVQTGPIYSFFPGQPPPPAGPAPKIDLLQAYPTTVKPGQPAIIYWSTTGESMRFLSTAGALRTNWAIVHPSVTTTYTLTAQNKDGRVTQSVVVSVQP